MGARRFDHVETEWVAKVVAGMVKVVEVVVEAASWSSPRFPGSRRGQCTGAVSGSVSLYRFREKAMYRCSVRVQDQGRRSG